MGCLFSYGWQQDGIVRHERRRHHHKPVNTQTTLCNSIIAQSILSGSVIQHRHMYTVMHLNVTRFVTCVWEFHFTSISKFGYYWGSREKHKHIQRKLRTFVFLHNEMTHSTYLILTLEILLKHTFLLNFRLKAFSINIYI